MALPIAFGETDEVAQVRLVASHADQQLDSGYGCPVTGRFESVSCGIASVRLVGTNEPIRATGGHRLFSLSRSDWVGAANLMPGEWLDTEHGPRAVESVLFEESVCQPVFNLEVAELHEFRVGESGVRAHNDGPCPRAQARTITSQAKKDARRAARGKAGKGKQQGRHGKWQKDAANEVKRQAAAARQRGEKELADALDKEAGRLFEQAKATNHR